MKLLICICILLLGIVQASDTQTYFPMGGDDQTQFVVGDIETKQYATTTYLIDETGQKPANYSIVELNLGYNNIPKQDLITNTVQLIADNFNLIVKTATITAIITVIVVMTALKIRKKHGFVFGHKKNKQDNFDFNAVKS